MLIVSFVLCVIDGVSEALTWFLGSGEAVGVRILRSRGFMGRVEEQELEQAGVVSC